VSDRSARIAAENPFKAGLAARRRLLGFWSSLTSNLLAEIMADAGFDWILFDTEHAPNDLHTLIAQLQALRGSPVQPVVRPASNDMVRIKHLLDIGFRNLMIPYVQTAEEARQAVSATRYPPAGLRGASAYHRNNRYGAVEGYLDFIDDAIGILAQIETPAAAAALVEIGSVPGIDAVFVGPGDLAASLGHRGQVAHAEVQDAIQDIGERASQAGICAGIVAGNAADAARYLGWGYRFLTVGSDVATFRAGVLGVAKSLEPLRTAAPGALP
jgi:2-keto-3-deoxy-L-rhamnonate aldolase RhmA